MCEDDQELLSLATALPGWGVGDYFLELNRCLRQSRGGNRTRLTGRDSPRGFTAHQLLFPGASVHEVHYCSKPSTQCGSSAHPLPLFPESIDKPWAFHLNSSKLKTTCLINTQKAHQPLSLKIEAGGYKQCGKQ